MQSPVCLSQYFVNKQNVRNFKNVAKNCGLKCKDKELLKVIFESDANLLTFLPDDLICIISTIKVNTRKKAKEDFKQNFKTEEKTSNMQAVNKELIFLKCWVTLNEIIPRQFTGSYHNLKLLRSLIQCVIYSMRRQHIVVSKFIEKWDFLVPPWLSIPNTEGQQILYHILIWILKNILAAMISLNFYVTTCKIDADENMLHYFWKTHWQSFYDRKISDMMFTKVIEKCESLSLGRKIKKRHNSHELRKLKSLKKEIPKLHLILKANNDCRPIVRYRNDLPNPSVKYKMKERIKFLKTLTEKPVIKIESEYKDLHQKWLNSNKPKLYFVKTDLSNAFGSVNKEKLLKILSARHTKFQKAEKDMNLKKRIAQQYKEMITELRKPLLVRAGSTVFKWKDGLVQGYKYSPALSELYYNEMDDLYFSNHFKKSQTKNKLFVRVVDDYLYITDCIADAQSFVDALSHYRNVNYKKTVFNFEHVSVKYSKSITFLGYSYNTKTLEVSRASNVFVGQMCYKIAFTSAIDNIQKFLENRIGQSGIQINGHIFNMIYNPEEIIWQHIFTTFCLSANKFCTILAVLCEEKEMLNYLSVYKKKVVVKLSNTILETLLKNKPADYYFTYCINHLRHISWKALHLCAKGTPKCSGLIPMINDQLAKTNCLFGKWREHASGINITGQPFRSATKEICRRSDLRSIVKLFNRLPEGFECYNHRNIVNKTK